MSTNQTTARPARPVSLRNVSMGELVARLETDEARKVDLVVPRGAVTVSDGLIHVAATDQIPATTIAAGPDMLGTMADRLAIPVRLLRELDEQANPAPPADDADVFQVLEADAVAADYRTAFDALVGARFAHHAASSFMLRTYRPDDGSAVNYGRALLSSRFAALDNRMMLAAVLQGCQQAGMADSVQVHDADLTDNRMAVRIVAPTIAFAAHEFLKGYRSPYRRPGEQSPMVFAGILLTNSELGGGAVQLTPRVVFEACSNGLQMTKDVERSIHVGARLEEGRVEWSQDTHRRNLELITAKTADAVRRFLSMDYVETAIASLTRVAGVEVADPMETVAYVAKESGWTDAEMKGIFNLFIQGGQTTAGGVLQAVTAHVQTVADPDRAHELEAGAVGMMELAAAHAGR